MKIISINKLVAACSMLLPLLLQAQYVFTSTAPVDSITPTVSQWPKSQFTGKMPFTYTRVIDNRTDTAFIGLNSARFIRMQDEQGALYPLQKMVDAVYGGSLSGNGDTLVMVINKLVIASNMHYEKGSWKYLEDITDGIRIAADFYRSGIDGYKLLYRFHYFDNPVLDNRKSWAADEGFVKREVSSSWSQYLVELFDTAFSALDKNKDLPPGTAPALASLSALKTGMEPMPVNENTVFKKGIYRNFNEFTGNAPGIPIGDDSKLTPADSSCWGFCDGEHIFYRNGNAFYQVEPEHGVWYFTSGINALRKKTRQSDLDPVFGFTFFRLLTHPDEGKHGNKNPTPLVMIRIQNKNIIALRIDPLTGQADF